MKMNTRTRESSLVALTALSLLACPTTGDDKAGKKVAEKPADPGKKPDVKPPGDPKPELVGATASTGCTVDFTSQKVDGSSLWADLPDASAPKNCNFHRLAFNNFLYLVDIPDGASLPRFMTELASTQQLAKTGDWPTAVRAALKTRSIRNIPHSEFENGQAGDSFELLDVASQIVLYDIRINQTMWDSIKANNWNTDAGLAAAATAYAANSQTGGIWLPPNTGDPSIKNPSSDDSIEIKTSWRNFGSTAGACPSDIMFCIVDGDNDNLGLLGMHLVQKTPTRGEWVWASFEHVSNSPDCSPSLGTGASAQATSNPLQQFPRDPTNPSATINVNKNVPALAAATGWSAFNFNVYKTNGGNGTSCDFSQGTAIGGTACTVTSGPPPTPSPWCNGNPNPSGDGKTFVQTNVCRTDEVPDHSTPASLATVCANTNVNGNNVACLSQSVLDNFPAGIEGVWKYYMLAGAQWLDATSVQTVGCFGITDVSPANSFACPTTPPGAKTFATTGTVALANTTMETWMQAGTCISYTANKKAMTVGSSDCFTCHQPPTTQSKHGDLSHALSAF